VTNLSISAVALLAAAGIILLFLRGKGPGVKFGVPGALIAAALVLATLGFGDKASENPVADADPGGPLTGLERAPALDPPAPDINSQGANLISQGRAAANAGRDDDARELFNRAMKLFQAAKLNSGMGEVKLQTGILDQIVGQGEQAREVFRESHAFFVAAADPVGQAHVALALGDLEKAQFNNDAALVAFSNAQILFHDQGDWTREAEALLGRGHAQRRLHFVLASRRSVARAMAIYEILEDTAGLRNATQSVDELETYQDKNDRQEEHLNLERTNAQQAGDASAEADVLVRIGELNHRSGRPESARDAFTQAAALWAGERRAAGQARALANLGYLEIAIEHFDAAAAAFSSALSFYQEAEDSVGTAQVLVAQAALEIYGALDPRQLYAQAQSLFEAAEQPSEQRIGIGKILLGLGELDRKSGLIDEARLNFETALEMFSEAGILTGQAQSRLALGDLDLEMGNLDAAIVAYEQSLDLFHQSLYRPGEAWAHLGLGATLAATNAQEASVNYRIAARIFDDLGMEARVAEAIAAATALE
jgi:tetratricopeptide (TPR) repeat protein